MRHKWQCKSCTSKNIFPHALYIPSFVQTRCGYVFQDNFSKVHTTLARYTPPVYCVLYSQFCHSVYARYRCKNDEESLKKHRESTTSWAAGSGDFILFSRIALIWLNSKRIKPLWQIKLPTSLLKIILKKEPLVGFIFRVERAYK